MRMYALYTNSGAPVAGLTLAEVVFTVKAIKKADYALTTPINAQASIADIGGGYYLYDYAAADPETYDYVWYAQYTGATSVDSVYVYGQSDALALVDDVAGFTTTGKAEIQQEAEDALTAYGAAKTSDLSDMALDSTVAKEATVAGIAADYAKTGEAAAASSQGEAATWTSQGEAAAASSQGEAAAALASWVSSYEAPLLRILGLVQENQKITSPVFDASDHMTSCTITIYTDATLITPLATYNMTATYDGDGNLATYQVVKA